MRLEYWAQLLPLVVIVILGFWFRSYITKYVNKKAENLAQKEDLEKLTEITERIRAQFDRTNVVHRVQFEAEFRAYQETWLAAHNVFREFIRLNPMTGPRTQPRFEEFGKAQLSFTDILVSHQPFISESVSQRFNAFEDLMIDEKERGVLLAAPIPNLAQYRQRAGQALEQCQAAIKERLSGLLVI